MRKILVVLLALVFWGVAFASEINVKGSMDCYRGISGKGSSSKLEEVGFSLATEYLETINDFIKIGGGVEYVLPKSIAIGGDEVALNFSYVPIYFSIQANPVADEFFLKGNIGYIAHFATGDISFFMKEENSDGSKVKNVGGLYFAIGAGREFSSGLILDLTYSHYGASVGVSATGKDGKELKEDIHIGFHRIAFGVGYKFKLF